jgi:hypothetical protein
MMPAPTPRVPLDQRLERCGDRPVLTSVALATVVAISGGYLFVGSR